MAAADTRSSQDPQKLTDSVSHAARRMRGSGRHAHIARGDTAFFCGTRSGSHGELRVACTSREDNERAKGGCDGADGGGGGDKGVVDGDGSVLSSRGGHKGSSERERRSGRSGVVERG